MVTTPGEKTPVDLVVIGRAILTMDDHYTLHEPGYLAIDNGVIVGVGAADGEIPFRGKRLLHLPGHVITPGFINAHTHAPMTLFRGVADDLPLKEWLENHIWPLEARFVSPESVFAGTLVAAAEMALAGVTCFADMYFAEEEVARAASRVGIRAMVSEGILDFPTPLSPTIDDSFARARATVEHFRAASPLSALYASVGPHSPYTCSEATLLRARDLAVEFGVPLHIHLAEEKWEFDSFVAERSMTPIAYLESIGFFDGPQVIAAHVNWTTDEDLAILAERRVGVAHNPRSNMKLATGVCRVPAMLDRGVTVALGTDGASSNNTLSVLDEAQMAARLHKIIAKDPTTVAAREALAMATRGGAEALGLSAALGTLEPGKAADFVAFDFEKIHLTPVYDYYSHLIYAARASDVDFVYVGGKEIVARGRLTTVSSHEIAEIVGPHASAILDHVRAGSPKTSDA
jgi:5-methylthioadenosine/S-adenosylhomocysteine deaminase